MTLFRQTVFERREYEMEYFVEAETLEDAERKFSNGDAISEKEIRNHGVQERHTFGDIEIVTD